MYANHQQIVYMVNVRITVGGVAGMGSGKFWSLPRIQDAMQCIAAILGQFQAYLEHWLPCHVC